MSFKHRRLAATVSALALTLAVASCGGNTTGSGGGSDTLTFLVATSNPGQLKILNDIAAAYPQTNTKIKSVKVQTLGASDERTLLLTELATRTAPDVVWAGAGLATEFMDNGLLADLKPTLRKDSGYDFADLEPNLLKAWSRGDKLYGIPFSSSTEGVYYNADMFAKAGVPTPTQMISNGTWTWENFRAALKTVAQKNKVSGFYIPGFDTFDNPTAAFPLWYAYGASPWSTDGTQCGYTDPKMVAAMQLIHDMAYVDHSYPVKGQTADFASGSSAATLAYISTAGNLVDAKFKWDFVPTPAGPAGARPGMGQSGWVVFKNSQNVDAAADFVKFLTNKTNSAKMAAFFPPDRASLLTGASLKQANPYLTEQQLDNVVVKGATTATVEPVQKNSNAIFAALKPIMDGFWQPQANVAAVMQKACTAMQPLLTAK
ncbi:extracellular solute-binding protein [Rugosimonospora acidiphila]|uniref:Extracellular solute-binding protein n=1 Tax=Rugosimonospora acidiphila TaxID=556531 RepID=A0ABP9RKR4_9ACTN